MIKEYLLDLYILHLEKIFTDKDKTKKEYVWNKIKTNNKLLEFVTTLENNSFKSNIIVSKILKDEYFYDKDLYRKIVENIYNNRVLAEKKSPLYSTTFLMLTLQNENLFLSDEQKKLLLAIGRKSIHNNYTNETISTISHGVGLLDLKYKIITNKNFNETEKRNYFNEFYPEDELKLEILKELEWEIVRKLNLKTKNDEYNEIYELDTTELAPEIIELIKLCRYIKLIIPEETIKNYMNTL